MEGILQTFLSDRLPKRFAIEGGFVIGVTGGMSRQTDLIIYDSINSPVYRATKRAHIIPRNSVASVIEVKSKLNKEELRDAALKLAEIKAMKVSPISNLDQKHEHGIILDRPMTCVFAFDSYTSLDALAENLEELNRELPSELWVDMVVVLNKGVLSYAGQLPHASQLLGNWGGPTADMKSVAPVFVHLIRRDDSEFALNHFFSHLISHLAFFRQRAAIEFEGMVPSSGQVMTIQGYQSKLDGSLVPAESNAFTKPTIRYNIYLRKDKTLLGQVCYWPWQDGAVVTCSTRSMPPQMILSMFCHHEKVPMIEFETGSVPPLKMTPVLSLKPDKFEKIAGAMSGEIFAVKDPDGAAPPDPVYREKAPPRSR